MNNSEAILIAGKRFDELKMPNPAKAIDDAGNEVILTHPYDVIMATFPDIQTLKKSFADLEKTYSGPVSFQDYLQGLYNDLSEIPYLVSALKSGNRPANFEKITKSVAVLTTMANNMLTINNMKLAKFIR